MTDSLAPDAPHHGRVAALPRSGDEETLWVYVGDRLAALRADPVLTAGLAAGDLISFTLAAPDGPVATLVREGGPLPGAWNEAGDALRWRRPGAPSRMAWLRLRQEVTRAVRGYFSEEGFLEVETPELVSAPTPEAQFNPVTTASGYLITSPEFQLKRMVVGGFDKIVRIGPVFRGGEAGAHHNPEFTMVEWYRAHAGLDAMAADLESLLGRVAPLAHGGAGGDSNPAVPGNPGLAPALARRPFARATVSDLYCRHLGFDWLGATAPGMLRERARAAGAAGAERLPDDFEPCFFSLWERIEPLLRPEPLLVTEWPAPLASLARLHPERPEVAERMELYAGGLELANGFHELTDAAEQRRRFERDLAQRRSAGLPDVPLDERFLAALAQGMPPAAGMALGLDRLVMLIGGAPHIRDVLPFAWDEVE